MSARSDAEIRDGALTLKKLGEAMRPESMSDFEQCWKSGGKESFRLSREERDYVAGHALGSVHELSTDLAFFSGPRVKEVSPFAPSTARRLFELSCLLGDLGWEREAVFPNSEDPELDIAEGEVFWHLGEFFSVAQLKSWLEKWVQEDHVAAAKDAPQGFEKLGTGGLLLSRLEKWMASHEN